MESKIMGSSVVAPLTDLIRAAFWKWEGRYLYGDQAFYQCNRKEDMEALLMRMTFFLLNHRKNVLRLVTVGVLIWQGGCNHSILQDFSRHRLCPGLMLRTVLPISHNLMASHMASTNPFTLFF